MNQLICGGNDDSPGRGEAGDRNRPTHHVVGFMQLLAVLDLYGFLWSIRGFEWFLVALDNGRLIDEKWSRGTCFLRDYVV